MPDSSLVSSLADADLTAARPTRSAFAAQKLYGILKDGVLLSMAAGIVVMASPALLAAGLFKVPYRVLGRSPAVTRVGRRIAGVVRSWAEAIAPFVLKDVRDADVLPTAVYFSLIIIPFYFVMLFSGGFDPVPGLLFLGLLMGPEMRIYVSTFSMKHREAHRGTFFRGRLGKLSGRYFERVMGVFYGNVPGLDYPAHTLIHHGEYGSDDLQDALRHDRTTLTGFLRFLVEGSGYTNSGIGPILKLYRVRKWKMFRVMCAGFVGFYLFVAFSLWVNWRVALLCLIVPLCTNIFNVAVVVWAQHGFADPDDLTNPYKGAVTLLGVDSPGNENYHLSHHLKPAYHALDLPRHFAAHEAEFARHGHLVFEGLKLTDIWLLMCIWKRPDVLANHLVSPPLHDRDEAQVMLQRRMTWVRPRAGA